MLRQAGKLPKQQTIDTIKIYFVKVHFPTVIDKIVVSQRCPVLVPETCECANLYSKGSLCLQVKLAPLSFKIGAYSALSSGSDVITGIASRGPKQEGRSRETTVVETFDCQH